MHYSKESYVWLFLSIVAGAITAQYAELFILQDLSIYWMATTKFVQGLNPYDLPPLHTYITGYIGLFEVKIPVLKVWSSPTVFVLLYPLGLISLVAAKKVYLFVLTALLILSTRAVFSLFRICKLSALNLALILPLSWLRSAITFGGITWLVAPSLIAFAYYYHQKRYFNSGLALFATFFKPHLFYLFYYWLAIRCIRDRNWSLIAGTAFPILLMILVSTAINPHAFTDYSLLDLGVPLGFIHYTTTIAGVVSSVTSSAPNLAISISLLSGIILSSFFVYVLRYSCSIEFLLGIVPLSLLTSPYAWKHDYLCCCYALVAIALVAKETARYWWLWYGTLLGALAIFVDENWSGVLHPIFQFIIIIVIAVLCVIASQRIKFENGFRRSAKSE